MSKIVQAVNAMISKPENITTVIKANDEFFFLYLDKYKWSMRRRDDQHLLWFYPGSEPIEQLVARADCGEWEGVDMVTYNDKDIGTKEAQASFSELYTLLKERVFGVNKVLDDIIADSDLGSLPF